MTDVGGICCTSGLRTAFDLGRTRELREAVVALDVLGRAGLVLPEAVLGYAAERRGWKGLPSLRCAIALADPRSLSPGETRFRLLWVIDAALPVVNPDVLGPAGFLLGMVDLLDPDAGLVGEYDGAYHRDPRTMADDNAREEWIEDSGLVVVRAANPDLGPLRRRTVTRLVTAHRRGRQRDRRRDTWYYRPRPMPDVA